MRFEELPTFIKTMYEEQVEDELKVIWLSNPFKETSFAEYKEMVMKEHFESLKTKEDVEQEAEEGMNRALNLLNTLGGEGIGG